MRARHSPHIHKLSTVIWHQNQNNLCMLFAQYIFVLVLTPYRVISKGYVSVQFVYSEQLCLVLCKSNYSTSWTVCAWTVLTKPFCSFVLGMDRYGLRCLRFVFVVPQRKACESFPIELYACKSFSATAQHVSLITAFTICKDTCSGVHGVGEGVSWVWVEMR